MDLLFLLNGSFNTPAEALPVTNELYLRCSYTINGAFVSHTQEDVDKCYLDFTLRLTTITCPLTHYCVHIMRKP